MSYWWIYLSFFSYMKQIVCVLQLMNAVCQSFSYLYWRIIAPVLFDSSRRGLPVIGSCSNPPDPFSFLSGPSRPSALGEMSN